MKFFIVALATVSGLAGMTVMSGVHAQQSDSFTGEVRRVWEDGFSLDTGDRTFTVDSWEVCGDFTTNHVNEGDRLTITGEVDGRVFDAFSIKDSSDNAVCKQATSLGENSQP